MSDSFAARIAARFAPPDFANVYGFPNTVLDIKVWEDVLPKFGEYADDNPAQHLFEFHNLMDELNIHHEDVLMKLFMFSLEIYARLWYKSVPHSDIPSLKDFHILSHHGLSSCVPIILGFVGKSTAAVASHGVTVNNNVSYLITSPTPYGVIKYSIVSPFISSTFKRFVTIFIT
jgi:hypothetical protein